MIKTCFYLFPVMHQKHTFTTLIWSNLDTKVFKNVLTAVKWLRSLPLRVKLIKINIKKSVAVERCEEGLPGCLHFAACCLRWPQFCSYTVAPPHPHWGACDGLSSTKVQHEQQPLNILFHPIFVNRSALKENNMFAISISCLSMEGKIEYIELWGKKKSVLILS